MDTKHPPLQIFKPGRHTAMNGAVLNFGEADLVASAAAYDPAKHEAPIVVGHPKLDAPAYGWVKSLAFADDALDADPHQVDPAFAEMVASGRFKKISASFFAPDSPCNPVPGVYYLRHVGFLGAQPPAVKGLRNPSFADAEEGVVEFADWSDIRNAGLWRRMRDFFIAQFGLDKADSVIPDYAVADLEIEARKESEDDSAQAAPAPSFSAPIHQETVVTPEQKAALEAENAQLKQQLAERDAAAKQSHAAGIHAGHLSYAEALIKEGKLLPVFKDMAVATMDFMAIQDQVVEFGEGEAKKPLVDAFKDYLKAQSKQVEFGEVAKPEGQSGTVNFAAPAGFTVSAEQMELHQKALAHQAANKCGYEESVVAVSR